MRMFVPRATRAAALLALTALILAGQSAVAGLVVRSPAKATETADPTYLIEVSVLADDCALMSGDFFTLFDLFDTGVGESFNPPGEAPIVNPPNWGVSTPKLGQTNVVVPDDPNKNNVSFTYNGATTLPPGTELTFFFYIRINNALPIDPFPIFSWTSSCGLDNEVGVVTFEVFPLPEPSSVVLLGIGLACGGLGCAKRFRRQATSA